VGILLVHILTVCNTERFSGHVADDAGPEHDAVLEWAAVRQAAGEASQARWSKLSGRNGT